MIYAMVVGDTLQMEFLIRGKPLPFYGEILFAGVEKGPTIVVTYRHINSRTLYYGKLCKAIVFRNVGERKTLDKNAAIQLTDPTDLKVPNKIWLELISRGPLIKCKLV